MNPAPSFDNSYARLPERFYAKQKPEPVANPALIKANTGLAEYLGIDLGWLQSAEGIDTLAGNRLPPGASPISAAYAGHQFGGWNPQLGDGRAVLLGEVVAADGHRYDLQLKGSGRTPWSRGGDGRAPLGPVLREYLLSEAMAVLGVPTTRSLAAVSTGEPVYRQSVLPGAVLTRVARSHIRIGTFQYFSARRDGEALELLVQHVLERHYPQSPDAGNPALVLLQSVLDAQAELVAKWQLLGFIHGVMNTDNMLLSGETIDYGPCAFMDHFHEDAVYSSIDHQGRYAYRNQPAIAHWNLSCLAQCLLPLLDDNQETALALAQAAIDRFPEQYAQALRRGMNAKLGLGELQPDDEALGQQLLDTMSRERLDFSLTFRRLTELAWPDSGQASVAELLELPAVLQPWLAAWEARRQSDAGDPAERQTAMWRANPVFIPRNHLVEAALDQATNEQDYDAFHQLLEVLEKPFSYTPELRVYATPPRPEEVVQQTFCGT